ARLNKALEGENLPVNLINARFLKPLPEESLRDLFASGQPILVVEDVTVAGGLGSAMFEWAQANGFSADSMILRGYPDRFIEQGTPAQLRSRYGLDDTSLLQTIHSMLD
ncbi:MAG TPA: transketolase C-terminal domain-containing protein, partial [Bacillota bacterium]|nr:transketolase C-terminal domain-containing protein [Bacillota bacterium]